MIMKHVFLVNRSARDGKAGSSWDSIQHHFKAALPSMEVHYPTSGEESRRLAREAADQGRPVRIVTVGGEGTMNRSLVGIMESEHRDKVTMALVPFGNVNDYGANIGLQKTWQHALDTLLTGRAEKVGAIRMTADGKTEYALNIADLGFGATTAKSHSVDHQLSWLKGQFKYNILALKTLLKWKNVPARITVDKEVIEGDIAILLTGFSPTLGGFRLVPHASPTSPDLAVTIGINVTRLQILKLIESATRHSLCASEQIHFRRGRRVLVEATRPMVAEVDGEIVSVNSMTTEFEAMPGAISFMVPTGS
jgi:diacylglycerol kinase family enzyme